MKGSVPLLLGSDHVFVWGFEPPSQGWDYNPRNADKGSNAIPPGTQTARALRSTAEIWVEGIHLQGFKSHYH